MIKVLVLGEIIGIPTVKVMKKSIGKFIEKRGINFTLANGDGASDGYGLLSDTAYQIYNSGVNVITGGDCIFNKKDAVSLLEKSSFILRPFNLPKSSAGRGYLIWKKDDNFSIGVVSLLGRANFNKIFANDPFLAADYVVEKLKETTNVVIVDFHGGTTSEIQAMHWHLAGKASLVVGTQHRTLTSDNRIINDHTAVITGTGYCGGYNSICGLKAEIEIKKLKTGQFSYSKIEKDDVIIQGVIAEIDETTGKAHSIELVNEKL